jgi:YHS domain-containing protein
VGNVPLAAALWKGGISFGGVASFIYADLITLPLLLIYRKYYGGRLTLRLLGTFWLVMSVAGLATQYLFQALGAIPRTRPAQIAVHALGWNYTTGLDILALVLLMGIFMRGRRDRRAEADSGGQFATDPVCGMQVERDVAPAQAEYHEHRFYFCSDHCRDRFLQHPERFSDMRSLPVATPTPTVQLDPVCGMRIDPAVATAALVHQGHHLYFCSEHCRDRFQEQPDRFSALPMAPVAAVPSELPIDPICGMRVDPSDPGAKLEYPEGTFYFCCQPCADDFVAARAPATSPGATES